MRARAISTLAAAVLLGAASPPPPPVPDTPAVQQAHKFLAIVASDQDDTSAAAATRPLVRDPDARPPQTWPPFRAFIKGLQMHGVEHASATEAELTARDPGTEVWAHLTFTVEADEPHRIITIAIKPGPRPADVPAPKLSPGALAKAVREHVAELAGAGRFDGAVLIAEGGKPILTQAVGPADREANRPNTADTQFRFGSMGKMFTAVSVMQLVQAGKLDLKAPLGTYLKDYPNADIAQKVTIEQLLTHTGGTGDIFGPEFQAHRLELKDPKDYVDLYGARAPLFPPGSRQAYSNYGFMLLGRIVEVASGLSYDDYLARNIFAPAGMTATGMAPETQALPMRAVAYTGPPGQLRNAAETLPWRGTPAGGGYSTVGDLLRFSDALIGNRLLDPAHLRLLTTGGMTGADGKLIAFDFGGQTGDGRRYLGHNGGAPGMNGELRIFPDDNYVVVVLANRDPPTASGLSNWISERLP
jgi:CubicO group peptidase (beta-lactamase class C family)